MEEVVTVFKNKFFFKKERRFVSQHVNIAVI